MGINCALTDEQGSKLQMVIDEKNVFSKFVVDGQAGKLKLLKYIDPWGNTYFNSVQLDDLIEDIDAVIKGAKDAELTDFLSKVREYAHYCKNTQHTYIKFIGD